jgi:hypothetical protein
LKKAIKKKELTDKQIEDAFLANGGIPKTKKIKATMGRPKDYEKIDLEQIKKFAKAGLSNEQIAELTDICIATLYNYQRDYPDFLEALKGGKENPDDKVERALYERAVGYLAPEEKVFYDANQGVTVSKTILRQYPPDTAAAFIWLQNRRPSKWKVKQVEDNEKPQGVTEALQNIAKALMVRDG